MGDELSFVYYIAYDHDIYIVSGFLLHVDGTVASNHLISYSTPYLPYKQSTTTNLDGWFQIPMYLTQYYTINTHSGFDVKIATPNVTCNAVFDSATLDIRTLWNYTYDSTTAKDVMTL